MFAQDEVAGYQPKGPSRCFRQISLEYNTTGRYDYRRGLLGKPEEMIKDFSEADPVYYAEFCRSINLDGVLLLAVPEGGYTTYLQTRVGEPFPYLKQHRFDFFGQTMQGMSSSQDFRIWLHYHRLVQAGAGGVSGRLPRER